LAQVIGRLFCRFSQGALTGMARVALLFSLLVGVAATAPVDPCAPPAPVVVKKAGLTLEQKIAIGVSAASATAVAGAGLAGALATAAPTTEAPPPPVVKAKETAAPTAAPTTVAPCKDSSSGSSGDSSASLESLTSGSSDSLTSGDSSGSQASLGSTALGLSGFCLPILAWVLLIGLLLICIGVAAASSKKSKKRGTKKKKAAPAPAPAAEPEVEVAPLLPALMPLATTSAFMPSYQMAAAPQMMTTSYAAPQMTYAAPMTTAYAAPMTTAYAAPMYQEQVQYAQPTYTTAVPMAAANYGGAVVVGQDLNMDGIPDALQQPMQYAYAQPTYIQ